MTASLDAAFTFTDPQGLASLRRGADSPDARRAVAQQFEALFLGIMLKQMRSASAIEGGLIDRERMSVQESMLDGQLALTLARGQGIGLADSILRSLNGAPRPPVAKATALAALPRFREVNAPRPGGVQDFPVASRRPAQPSAVANPAAVAAGHTRFDPESPAAFVAAVWPHAEEAARRLGVSPEILVAQSALETGWGRSMIRDARGQPSFNLFGVKAGASWEGPRAVVATLEFVDGLPQRQRETFRMYTGLQASFDDYVNIVSGHARYAAALSASSPEEYVRELQRGGYATDPEYADKILSIVARGLPGRDDQVGAPAADKSVSVEIARNEAGMAGAQS